MDNTIIRSQPKVSVCVFAYNHEKYLAEALNSVLSQQVDFDIEVIIAEDYSTDSTLQIAQDYQTRHPALIRVEQSGREEKLIINGRMTGRHNFFNALAKCRGKYIALLDGDDYWIDKFKLQKQVDFLELHPDYSFVFHNAVLISNNQNDLAHAPKFHANDHLATEDIDDLFVYGNQAPTSSVVFRNNIPQVWPEIFYKAGFADWPLHIFNLNYGKAFYMHEAMSIYHIGSGIWAKRAMSEQLRPMVEFYDYMGEILPDRLKNELPNALAEKWESLIHALVEEKRYFAALGSLFRHLRISPVFHTKKIWCRLWLFLLKKIRGKNEGAH